MFLLLQKIIKCEKVWKAMIHRGNVEKNSMSRNFMHHQQKVQNNKINFEQSRLLSSDKAKIA